MFTGMLHTHKLVVFLFLLIYVIKTALLLLNKTEALASFTKKVKVPEMIVSTLFLVTGLYMMFNIPEIKTMLIIKLVCVFASIPIAVIGFKKGNKALAALSLILIIAAYGLAEMSKKSSVVRTEPAPTGVISGADVYTNNCAKCHGADGKLGLAGAKDLSLSSLSDEEMKTIVLKGKNAMAGYEGLLSDEEVNAVVAHIKTLKQ